MDSRLELHEKLVEILGSRNVYFQPPENVKMIYPAIRYARSKITNTFANNHVYNKKLRYEVTVIDYDPDSEIVSKLSEFPMTEHDRHYTSDGLNHDVFTIYY